MLYPLGVPDYLDITLVETKNYSEEYQTTESVTSGLQPLATGTLYNVEYQTLYDADVALLMAFHNAQKISSFLLPLMFFNLTPSPILIALQQLSSYNEVVFSGAITKTPRIINKFCRLYKVNFTLEVV